MSEILREFIKMINKIGTLHRKLVMFRDLIEGKEIML